MKPWQVELEGGWWLWFKLLKTNVTLFGSPETGEGLYTGGFGVGWLSWKLAVCIALHKCAINVFSHLFLSGQSCLKKCVSQDKKNLLQGKLRQGLTLGDSNPKNAQDYRSNLKACCTWTTAVSSPCWSALALVIGYCTVWLWLQQIHFHTSPSPDTHACVHKNTYTQHSHS